MPNGKFLELCYLKGRKSSRAYPEWTPTNQNPAFPKYTEEREKDINMRGKLEIQVGKVSGPILSGDLAFFKFLSPLIKNNNNYPTSICYFWIRFLDRDN